MLGQSIYVSRFDESFIPEKNIDFYFTSMHIAEEFNDEFKNKGIDVYIDALSKINNTSNIPVLAYILVPAWHSGAKNLKYNQGDRITTHNLMQPDNDPVLCALKSKGLVNSKENNVKVIFVPAYLCGDDGVFDLSYYRLLSGFDMTLFPSYYEPWGYTPLESVFFGIPTVTTSLSGF